MKIIILHLSDVHIKTSRHNPVLSRAQQIAAAVVGHASDADACFVATTGDIAFSGKQEEYELARPFFGGLFDHLAARLPNCCCEFVFVPGNHDCDFTKDNRARQILLGSSALEKLDKSVFSQCTAVQCDYWEFANQWRSASINCNSIYGILECVRYDLSQQTVEFRLLNSAWMSMKDEIQGKILFPLDVLPLTDHPVSPADITIAMCHHPYNWFDASNARVLWRQLEDRSDFILTGHEHDGETYQKTRGADESVDYIEGAVLQESADPRHSGFHVLIIDTTQLSQTKLTFAWNTGGFYEPVGDSIPDSLRRNRHRLRNQFLLAPSFEADLKDPGACYTHPEKPDITLDDLYIYPDLRILPVRPNDDFPSRTIRGNLPEFILEHKHMLLMGSEKSGKTSLAKRLFQDFRGCSLTPLYLSGEDLKGYSSDSIRSRLKRDFCAQYESPDFELFLQLGSENRAVILDDFHMCQANSSNRARIIESLQSMFGVVVVLGDVQLRFGATGSRDELPLLWNYVHCELLPLGHLRKAELIEKWYFLGERLAYEQADLRRRARDAEKVVSALLDNHLVPSYPLFILVILQQIEARTSLDLRSTSGSYCFLYEALLTMALTNSSNLRATLDTQYNYLSELAYHLYQQSARSMERELVLKWHRSYCETYDIELEFSDLVSSFCNASVLCETNGTLAFRYPYLYYYFVGRYFRDHIGEEDIREYIRWMSHHLNHTESANVLLFLSYLSRDPFIISTILQASQSLFSSHRDYDLDGDAAFPNSLNSDQTKLIIDAWDPEQNRRRLLERRDELEADDSDRYDDEWIDEDKDTVNADDELDQFLQINVVFKTIQILGQILRNYPGSLKGDRKVELAKEGYSLGLRVLHFLHTDIEANCAGLSWFLSSLVRDTHPNWDAERRAGEVARLLTTLLEGITLAVIKRVSDSIGLRELSQTFDKLLEQEGMLSHRFIDISVRLDYYRKFPDRHVFDLAKTVRHNPFAQRLLSDLVWYYFYINPSTFKLRQKVGDRLGIRVTSAVAHDPQVKRLKG
jgi:calcineurin-like phosphoesterase family protein